MMKSKHSLKTARSFPWIALLWTILLIGAILMAASFHDATEKWVGLFAAITCSIVCLTPAFRHKFKDGTSIFFLLVLGYVVLSGLSTLYGDVPPLAMPDYCRLLAGFAFFLIVYTFYTKERLRTILSVAANGIAFLSFLAVDTASARWIGEPFYNFLIRYIPQYIKTQDGYNQNRLYGLFGNSNTMAFLCAMGAFFALYLLLTASQKKERIYAIIPLFINTFAFIMCVSLGAMASLAVALLVCFIFARSKTDRSSFFLIVLETLFSVLLCVLLSYNHFGGDYSTGWIVILMVGVGIVLLCILDLTIRNPLVKILEKYQLIFWSAILTLPVLCAVGLGFVFSQTTSLTLTQYSVYKTIYPGAGECTITMDTEGEGKITVYANSKVDIQQSKDVIIFESPVAETSTFTIDVPEAAAEVKLLFQPTDGATLTIHRLSYEGSEDSGNVPVAYCYLPQNIVNRLDGLRTNHSATIRFVMMQDGLKLWQTAPLFGNGLAGYNNGILSVQDYYYETQYAHNHWFQCLCDVGIVGTLLYAGIFLAGFVVLWQMRKKDDTPLYLILFGAMILTAVHGTLEFTMSVGEGICSALIAWGLIAANAQPVKLKIPSFGKIIAWSTTGFCVLYMVLMIGHHSGAKIVNNLSYIGDLETAAKLDVFDRERYLLTYVHLAPQSDNPEILANAERYAEKLERSRIRSIPKRLTEYYFKTEQPEKAVEMANLYLTRNRSDSKMWDEMFQQFETMLDSYFAEGKMQDAVTVAEQFLKVYDRLVVLNKQQQDNVLLNERSSVFVSRLLSWRDAGELTETALRKHYMEELFDFKDFPDVNTDEYPDLLTSRNQQGSLEKKNGITHINETFRFYIPIVPKVAGIYKLQIICSESPQVGLSDDFSEKIYQNGSLTAVLEVTDEMVNVQTNISFAFIEGGIVESITLQKQ